MLAAVGNWKSVPPSVFPLSGVTIKKALNFELKTLDGKTIGSVPRAAGMQVVAMALKGTQLHVSFSKSSKARSVIQVDQTDFKSCVAHLFELRKTQREKYEERKKERSKAEGGKTLP